MLDFYMLKATETKWDRHVFVLDTNSAKLSLFYHEFQKVISFSMTAFQSLL